MISGYDIIGDIHGHHDKLISLLRKLNYRERDGAWRHPGRQALFVGDLIDRGPAQVDTVMTVRHMVDAGTARCIMGNHEFNAVAWVTPDPRSPGEYLRPHAKANNRVQHAAFLTEVEGRSLHAELVDWFRKLPLWIEEPGIRVVHACWHDPSIEWLRARLNADRTLPDAMFEAASRRGSEAYVAVETACKGLEVALPEGKAFVDKSGLERHEARIRWWLPELVSYREAVIVPPDLAAGVPDLPFPQHLRPQPYSGPPVFFGHYWFTGEPAVLRDNAVCLDYSAARDGPLVAYRWDGESRLRSDRLTRSDS